MRFLLLNQTFYPDVAATGQYLGDLAKALAARGHLVTVVTSRRAYENPNVSFPARESWNGVEIMRVSNTRFGKAARWQRAADFASFIVSCCARLLFLPRPDVVISLTTPPLISFIGAVFSKLKGAKSVYWIMDLNPDEAIAAGWLRPDSVAARVLEQLSRFSLRQAAKIVVLDRFMEQRIADKGIPQEKLEVLPPWSLDGDVRFHTDGRQRFRREHGLADKFVVMYAGNHSPCHPLSTVLSAMERLAKDPAIHFCFVGGGSELPKVKAFAAEKRLRNVTCLPYRPLSELGAVLSAADVHLAVMGGPFVGLVHPCKVYNILRVGAPLLYLGPSPSHISELLSEMPEGLPCARVTHGDVDGFVAAVRDLHGTLAANAPSRLPVGEAFRKETLLPRFVDLLEALSPTRAAASGAVAGDGRHPPRPVNV